MRCSNQLVYYLCIKEICIKASSLQLNKSLTKSMYRLYYKIFLYKLLSHLLPFFYIVNFHYSKYWSMFGNINSRGFNEISGRAGEAGFRLIFHKHHQNITRDFTHQEGCCFCLRTENQEATTTWEMQCIHLFQVWNQSRPPATQFARSNSQQSQLGAWYKKSSIASSEKIEKEKEGEREREASRTVFDRKKGIAKVWPTHLTSTVQISHSTSDVRNSVTWLCNLIAVKALHPWSTESKPEGSGNGY